MTDESIIDFPKRETRRVRLDLSVPLADKLVQFAQARNMSQAAVVEGLVQKLSEDS